MKSSLSALKRDCLFLWLNQDDFFPQQSAQYGVNVRQVFINSPTIFRILRRIQIELNIPPIFLWLSSWKWEVKSFRTVIIHASRITVPVVKYLKRVDPSIRIIVWYWNPVDKTVPASLYPDSLCEKWSFDESDCRQYNLRFNTQYYFKDIILPTNRIDFDVCFVGGDKGRMKNLMEVKRLLDNCNLKSYFHITATKQSRKEYGHLFKKRIGYQAIIDYISRSRAVLDFVSLNQTGLTLRPLEALFFRKKLITNDTEIVERDFYIKENIFVLGQDKLSELPDFLNSPYKPINQEIIDRYEFDRWFGRFFSERTVQK